MRLIEVKRLIATAAVLGIQLLHPAAAADHYNAPLLPLEAVVFEGSRPVFDAADNLVSVGRVHFSAVTAAGLEIEGSGELTLPEQHQDAGDHALTGSIDDILGRIGDIKDGTSKTFMGRAQVSLNSFSVDQQLFAASGGMQLQAEILEPVLVHEFDIEADAVQTNDGRWSAHFHGADRLGLGVRIDGFYVPANEWGVWDDPDIVHLEGEIKALALKDSAAESLSFEDKAGEEEIYFTYDEWGNLSHISPSTEVEGRFSARLTLRLIGHDAASHDDVLNIQVGDVIVSESARTPDGRISGRAEVFFSGGGGSIGTQGDLATAIKGTAEFRFQGDAVEGVDWFMAGGEWRFLSATIEDAATGGTILFEDISGKLGQARIIGTIGSSGQVDLTGGLGQITVLDQDLDT